MLLKDPKKTFKKILVSFSRNSCYLILTQNTKNHVSFLHFLVSHSCSFFLKKNLDSRPQGNILIADGGWKEGFRDEDRGGGGSNYGNMVFEWDGVVDPREFF